MSKRQLINRVFQGKAFNKPLFYSHENESLRFQLSEGGSYIDQFLTANKKAFEICQVVFSQEKHITICLKWYGSSSLLASLSSFREFKELDFRIPKNHEHWVEQDEDDESLVCHYLVFDALKSDLRKIIWCACAGDFGSIKPNPRVDVYLFNLDLGLVVHPYDDRGMDIAGKNYTFLKSLYDEFNSYLLDYDRDTMKATFA